MHVVFERGLSKFWKQVNAYPTKTRQYKPIPSNEIEAFRDAYEMLGDQLEDNRDYFAQVPVLIIDTIKMIDDKTFSKLAAALKNLVDLGLLKVVILASNGANKEQVLNNVDLMNRLKDIHEIVNDFDESQIEQVLRRKTSVYSEFCKQSGVEERVSLIVKSMQAVSGGRIGYINKLCGKTLDSSTITNMTINAGKDGDTDSAIMRKIETVMVKQLYDKSYRVRITKAFVELERKGIHIDGLISENLPSKVSDYVTLDTLVFHNIIDNKNGNIEFESEPLRRIFKSDEIRQDIKKQVRSDLQV